MLAEYEISAWLLVKYSQERDITKETAEIHLLSG